MRRSVTKLHLATTSNFRGTRGRASSSTPISPPTFTPNPTRLLLAQGAAGTRTDVAKE